MGLLIAGGHGGRLRTLTYASNKHMLQIANAPILFYNFNPLKNVGVNEVAVFFGPEKYCRLVEFYTWRDPTLNCNTVIV